MSHWEKYNGFRSKQLSNGEIYKFIKGIWEQYEISSTMLSTIPEYIAFIQRIKFLITEELLKHTKDFQSAVSKEYAKYQKGQNIFELQFTRIHDTQFLLQYNEHSSNKENIHKLSNKYKERMTFICKCTFEKLHELNIIDIINSHKFLIEAEYLNHEKSRNYVVVNVTSLYDKQIQKEYIDHIKDCEWFKTVDYPLNLYKWQIKHCYQFIEKCINALPNKRRKIENDKEEDDYEEDIDLDPINMEIENNRSDNNNQYIELPLEQRPYLSCIQSVILNKSVKHCNDQLLITKQSYHDYKDEIIELMNYNNWKAVKSPNKSQYEAIIKSILSPLSLIHGPPGTGKTSTCGNLVNTILTLKQKTNHIIQSNGKIFVCAYTHNAVNELLDKITLLCPNYIDNILRLGDVERVKPKKLKQYCFDMRLKRRLQEIEEKQQKKPQQTDIDNAIKEIFNTSMVYIGTVYTANNRKLKEYIKENGKNVFDYVIIDECTQILDPILNIAVNIMDHSSNNTHIILIGDHKQLPPVIKSSKVRNDNRKITLFEQLINTKEDKSNFYTLLNKQYRMPRILMEFSNYQFYQSRIESFDENVNLDAAATQEIFHLISTRVEWLTKIKTYYTMNIPIFVINVMNGRAYKNGTSWQNREEAEFIGYLLDKLAQYKTLVTSTGVISFYREQANCIREKIRFRKELKDVLVSTVDAFQGKEKELIILSLVRDVTLDNNTFNCDYKRINVALTRCKKGLIVVTSFDVTKNNRESNIWTTWFKHFRSLTN